MLGIKQIIEVNPYSIICLWDNGEVRTIDLGKKLKEWTFESEKINVYQKLLNKEIFSLVKLDNDTKTLYWDNLLIMTDTQGNKMPAPLDFCPDFLYEISKPEKKK